MDLQPLIYWDFEILNLRQRVELASFATLLQLPVSMAASIEVLGLFLLNLLISMTTVLNPTHFSSEVREIMTNFV